MRYNANDHMFDCVQKYLSRSNFNWLLYWIRRFYNSFLWIWFYSCINCFTSKSVSFKIKFADTEPHTLSLAQHSYHGEHKHGSTVSRFRVWKTLCNFGSVCCL